MSESTYTYARAHLAELWDRAVDDCEPVLIKRRGAADVALISAAELQSMRETLYLLASPANGIRLLTALQRAAAATLPATDIGALTSELGIETVEPVRRPGGRRRTAS